MGNKQSDPESNQPVDLLGDWDFDLGIPSPVVTKYPKLLEEFPAIITSIKCMLELFDSLAFYRSFQHKYFFFRGHSDSEYSLLSTIGRATNVDYSNEYAIFRELKTVCDDEGYARYRLESFNEELFYYSVGRHLGLTCRLLDWTAGFWEALSFALYGSDEKDGALWVMMLPNDYPLENRSPFSIQDDRIHILKEDYYTDDCSVFPLGIQRRSRQHGFFSVVKESLISTPLNEVSTDTPFVFYCFIIPKEEKGLIRQDKHLLNVDRWLYVNDEAPIINKIKYINRLITNSVGL